MIGSLGQFLPLQSQQILAFSEQLEPATPHLTPPRMSKRRGRSTFQNYVPLDKTDLLARYQKNNIYHINRKKYTSIEKQAHSKDIIKRPLYQHRSFFVKPEIAKDYISKQELKRKHNLLRAIIRMKKNEEQPKGESDYQQSFQRLYSGFRSIHPNPVLQKKQEPVQEEEMVSHKKSMSVMHGRSKSSLPHRKRLEFEHCLSWAKKHKKNCSYFAEQLGKVPKGDQDSQLVVNRLLIDEIGKKVDLSWLE